MSKQQEGTGYSFFPALQQQPDRIALTLAEGLKAAFIDQGFINTMRFSELNGDEEYDNTFLYIAWHGYLETGIQQLREYNEWLNRELETIAGDDVVKNDDYSKYLNALLENQKVKDTIPYDQRMRIKRYIQDYMSAWTTIGTMSLKGERDGKKAIGVVRQYLGDYNENLGVDFTLFYDGHTALLNGRMARGRGHKKEIMSVAHGSGVDAEVDDGKKKHFWSRG